MAWNRVVFLLNLLLATSPYLWRAYQAIALLRPLLKKILRRTPLLNCQQFFNCYRKPRFNVFSINQRWIPRYLHIQIFLLKVVAWVHKFGANIFNHWSALISPHIDDSLPHRGLKHLLCLESTRPRKHAVFWRLDERLTGFHFFESSK